MISIPWSCVTHLKLEPVGPINPMVFGLWWDAVATEPTETAMYRIAEPHKVRMMRDALGSLVDSPTGLRRPEKYPFYQMLCELQRGLNP